MHQLQAHPWLLVLDGLERVLVFYHRFDAAQVPDDVVNSPTDPIVNRDACLSIRPEDNHLYSVPLLRRSHPKYSSHQGLFPECFLMPRTNRSPAFGAESLPGLLPADAEALLRSCEITGNSKAIQNIL